MQSQLMTKDEILEYAAANLDCFSDIKNLSCQEIGDGNINYVFKVTDSKTGRSLVVKQSDTLLRSSGRPLDIHRSEIEAKVLSLQYELFPGSVPKVFLYDKEKSLIVMEDISAYGNLRKELMDDKIYDHLADSLSDFVSKTLIPTTDLVIDRKEKKQRVREFMNPDLCDISEDLVFTEPYYNYRDRNIISQGLDEFVEENLYKNKKLHVEVLKLKDRFQTDAQGLLHGDLHSGSIFVNEDGIKVIDPEFAFYGPIGYDIGNILGNLFFSLTNSIVLQKTPATVEKLKNLIVDTIQLTGKKLIKTYDECVLNDFYKNPDYKSYYIDEIISDSYGYAGTEIIRRVVGDSKVIEVTSVKDTNKRMKLDKTLIKTGIYLIENRYGIADGKELMKKYEDISAKYMI